MIDSETANLALALLLWLGSVLLLGMEWRYRRQSHPLRLWMPIIVVPFASVNLIAASVTPLDLDREIVRDILPYFRGGALIVLGWYIYRRWQHEGKDHDH